MKIFITGASGFVGKELVSELKNQKFEVFEYNFSDKNNILNKQKLNEKMKGKDVVIHLAAKINNNDKNLWKINVEGTKNVIDSAVKNKIKKFIFLSSTGVYGTQNGLINEKTMVAPETKYEKSKVQAERIVLEHQEEIFVAIIRSAMILGNNEYWKKMFKVLKKELPLPCFGKNKFQIIYVKELIRIIILLIDKMDSGEIYLASGKEKWTLREFCKKLKGKLGKKELIWSVPWFLAIFIGKIFNIKLISMENIRHLCKNRNYDTKKIEKLGYIQKIKLEEAIIETIEEIKEINSL